jgi:hypothetical protein
VTIRTWQVELLVVATGLAATVYFSCGGWREALTAAAVLAGFAHAQVSDRLAEMEGRRTQPEVHCWRWSLRYFVAKEALWFAVFAAYRNWSALAGVVLFLLYPGLGESSTAGRNR